MGHTRPSSQCWCHENDSWGACARCSFVGVRFFTGVCWYDAQSSTSQKHHSLSTHILNLNTETLFASFLLSFCGISLLLSLCTGDTTLKVWDLLGGGRLVHEFSHHQKAITALTLDPTRLVATCSSISFLISGSSVALNLFLLF